MKSNYPRSDKETGTTKPRILAFGFGLAAAIHAFFTFTMPAHPAGKLAKYVPADSRIWVAVMLWTFSSIAAVLLFWKSSEWKAWDKFKLALTTGIATTVAALLLDMTTRTSLALAPEDYFALPAGSAGMTFFTLLIAAPIWIIASVVRKREAKSRAIHGELVAAPINSSFDSESLQDPIRSDAQSSVVSTNA